MTIVVKTLFTISLNEFRPLLKSFIICTDIVRISVLRCLPRTLLLFRACALASTVYSRISQSDLRVIHIMHVSRIAKETSRLTDPVLPASKSTRLQSRRFAQSLSTYVANGSSATTIDEEEEKIKEAVEDGDNSSELSSAGSTFSVDIENFPPSLTAARKRKRGADPAPTAALSITSTRIRGTQPTANLKNNYKEESKPRYAKKQPAKRAVKNDGQVEIHPPPRWEEVYDAVKEMRRKILAPVDTMGCETLAEDDASPRVCSRSTLSSSQTVILTSLLL